MGPSHAQDRLSEEASIERTSFALLSGYEIGRLAVFGFGSSFFTIFRTNNNLPYNLALCALFFIAAVWFKHDEHLEKYWRVTFAFFIATFATLSTLLLGGLNRMVLSWFNLTDATSAGMAISKVYEMLMIVVPIIVLTKLSGADLGSIYLKRGNLKWGLGLGLDPRRRGPVPIYCNAGSRLATSFRSKSDPSQRAGQLEEFIVRRIRAPAGNLTYDSAK